MEICFILTWRVIARVFTNEKKIHWAVHFRLVHFTICKLYQIVKYSCYQVGILFDLFDRYWGLLPKILPQVSLLGVHTPEALLLKPGLGFSCSLSTGPLSGSRMQLPKLLEPPAWSGSSSLLLSPVLSPSFCTLLTSVQFHCLVNYSNQDPRQVTGERRSVQPSRGTPSRRLAAIQGWSQQASALQTPPGYKPPRWDLKCTHSKYVCRSCQDKEHQARKTEWS